MSKWINFFWKGILGEEEPIKRGSGEIYFQNIQVLDTAPDPTTLKEKEFIKVIYKRKPYWAIFRCPCGCSTIISLPLQKSNHHYWHVYSSKNNRPNVYPSVWQNKVCCSHFVINDGKIIWCQNSGLEPYSDDELYY
jgi:hypothetical protein